ncbi:MAG: UDP-N-acetylmuramoyl-L-alanine--D-glutamate ligase [Candidatus Andersenbacteria bacterium]
MEQFRNKTILVLGLGLHGGAVGNIQYLASQGASLVVTDTKTEEQLQESITKLSDIPNIQYIFGNQDEISLDDIDFVLRNPAVPKKAVILENARTKNIPVLMDSSIFFEQVGKEHIIGITGSKGKTTTSHAIGSVLHTLDNTTITVGVDGVSPLGIPLLAKEGLGEVSDAETPSNSPFVRGREQLFVFELSSWRLEALQETHISPHIAVCTSIYKDHLNTYKNYQEYIDVKKQIIKDQTKNDVAILNYDDEIIKTWEQDVQGELYWYSLKPLADNQRGIWVDGEDVVARLRTSPSLSFVRRGDDGASPFSLRRRREGDEVICSVSDIPHTSDHELRNKLPAILIALLQGFEISKIIQAMQQIPPLKHRMQLVRELNGVQYINDTTATMPDAAIAGLKSLKNKPVILILGGSDKALEFEDFTTQISQSNIKHLIWLPGTATKRMQEIISPNTKAISHDIKNMQEAVELAHKLSQPGDAVLLSPGATSFGLFLHEFDRGDAFIKTVQEL